MSRTLQGLGLLFARGAATCSPVSNGLTAPLLICRTRLQNVCLETKMQAAEPGAEALPSRLQAADGSCVFSLEVWNVSRPWKGAVKAGCSLPPNNFELALP